MAESNKTWEVSYTKVGCVPIRNCTIPSSLDLANERSAEIQTRDSRFGSTAQLPSFAVSTKVDLHVRHVTTLNSATRPQSASTFDSIMKIGLSFVRPRPTAVSSENLRPHFHTLTARISASHATNLRFPF